MAAAQNSPLPEALTRAVHHVFGEWTALCMAVENDWGGQNTRDKALTLLERTLQALNTPVVHRDEVEAFLEDALVEDFNIEAEDESPRQVAEVLCKLHAEALAGSTATAALLAERAAAKGKSWVDAPLPPGRHRAGDSSDDESDDGEDGMDMEAGGGGGGGGEQSLAEMTKAVISSWGPELAPLWDEAVGSVQG